MDKVKKASDSGINKLLKNPHGDSTYGANMIGWQNDKIALRKRLGSSMLS
jgi:hypothetical protein